MHIIICEVHIPAWNRLLDPRPQGLGTFKGSHVLYAIEKQIPTTSASPCLSKAAGKVQKWKIIVGCAEKVTCLATFWIHSTIEGLPRGQHITTQPHRPLSAQAGNRHSFCMRQDYQLSLFPYLENRDNNIYLTGQWWKLVTSRAQAMYVCALSRITLCLPTKAVQGVCRWF